MNFGDSRLPQRFWDKAIPEPNSGCWLWIGATSSAGYGQIWSAGRLVYSHRLAVEVSQGPIAVHLEIDHRVCQTPCCCNPAHLEPITHAENIRRGFRLKHMAVTQCPRGHAFDENNTLIRRRGTWIERVCRSYKRLRYQESKAKAV